MRFQSAGEGSFFVAEEFAFNQRGHERSAIDGDEGTVREGAAEMNGAGDKLFAGTAFAGDKYSGARVFKTRGHAQHFLNLGGGTDDAMHGGLGIHALAQEFVFLDQADFLRHAAQKQPKFFEWRKRLGDVVVGAELHGLHCGLNRAVSGHERDFGAGQKFLDLLQKFEAGHVRHDHVAEDHVHRLLFEQGQRRLAALGFKADESQSFAHGDAELADALLVIDDQAGGREGLLCRAVL